MLILANRVIGELPAAELDHYDRRLVKDKSLVCELIFLSA